MSEALIQISNLEKSFGGFKAVDGISFSVQKGEVLGFLGPNGAGKSTTMKMITGFLTPTAGDISICGHNVLENAIAAQRLIGYLPEGAPAYAEMSPLQFLEFVAEVRGLRGEAKKKAIASSIDKTELHSVLHQNFETLSKGFKRRVGLAQAVLHDPPVLIMDEPTDGLDPNQKHAVRKLISGMAKEKAIIVSTHILEEVEAICSRAMIIDRGQIVADGTPGELAARSDFHNAVNVVVASGNVKEVRGLLNNLKGVRRIDEHEQGNEVVLTLLPKGGGRLIDEVSQALSSSSIEVRGLYVDAGRLDDVFRQLTTSDAVADKAAKGGSTKSSGKSKAA